MSALIFKFTLGCRVKTPVTVGDPAAIIPFPARANGVHVANVVAQMRKCADFDAAKEHLTWHLDLWWERLLDLGVSDQAAENDCRGFVAAAFESYDSGDDEQGAA